MVGDMGIFAGLGLSFSAGHVAQGSRVATRDGIKAVENVLLSDSVLACDPNDSSLVWASVERVKLGGVKEIGVAAANGASMHCTDDCALLSYDRDSRKYMYVAARKTRSKTAVTVDGGLDCVLSLIEESRDREVGCLRIQLMHFEMHGANEPVCSLAVGGPGNFVCEGFVVKGADL